MTTCLFLRKNTNKSRFAGLLLGAQCILLQHLEMNKILKHVNIGDLFDLLHYMALGSLQGVQNTPPGSHLLAPGNMLCFLDCSTYIFQEINALAPIPAGVELILSHTCSNTPSSFVGAKHVCFDDFLKDIFLEVQK